MATNNNNVREYPNINGKVQSVILSKGTTDRMTFNMSEDVTFKTIDFETGEEKDTNSFSLKIFNIVNQTSGKVNEVQLANMMCLGKMMNPKIISIIFTGAEVEIKREFKKKGEKRENTNDTYEKDCIVSKFVSVKVNINPLAVNLLNHLIMTEPFVETVTIPNPFGI